MPRHTSRTAWKVFGMTPPSSFLLLLLCLFFSTITADCECGYSSIINGTTYVFSDLLETDFLHLASISLNTDWRRQEYNVTAKASRGVYGTQAQVGNVISNPVADNFSYIGSGIHGNDAGLQLYVREGIPPSGLVRVAEVNSVREDMLWGSYRAAMKLTDKPGTCGSFFWYFNDSQEIDMEFLSSQFSVEKNSFPVNLVLQSPQSAAQGFTSTASGDFIVANLPFNPMTGYHEYRIDFVPGSVIFYADGHELATMRTSAVPSHSGHLILTQWSNGNALWSAGPPSKDAVMTVSYVKAYFNSSLVARTKGLAVRCNQNGPNAICAIPDQKIAPNADSTEGNKTANTYFFSNVYNKSTYQIVSHQSSALGKLATHAKIGTVVLALIIVAVTV